MADNVGKHEELWKESLPEVMALRMRENFVQLA